MFLGSLIYGLIFSVATVGRYYTFHTFAWDLGVYSQGLFTTAHANGFFLSTPDQPNNPGGSLFGVHFAPVLFLLVPLYWLVPSPATLLVVQSFALGSGAPILFRLVRSRLPSDRVAAAFALAYLLNPALQGVNWFDFHPEAFLVPFVFVAMYAWERRSWRWFWLAIGASLSTLEMSGVALLALGLFWVLDGFRPRDVRSWLRQEHTKHAALVCVAGTAWTLVGIQVIFAFNPGLAAERHSTWQPLGASSIYQLPEQLVLNPLGVLNGLASEWPFKLLYLFLIFGPVLFLPFRRPLTVLMPAPWMVLALTGTRRSFYTIGNQYPSFVLPFLFYGAILGLARFPRGPREVRPPNGTKDARIAIAPAQEERSLLILGAAAVAFLVLSSPLLPVRAGTFDIGGPPVFDAHVSAVWQAVNLVPPGASILAQNNLFPTFSDRTQSYVVPVGTYFRPGTTFNSTLDSLLARVDYVLVDAQASVGEAESVLNRPTIRSDFGLVAWIDGVILLRRGFTGAPAVYRPFSAFFDPRDLALLGGSIINDPRSIRGEALHHLPTDGPAFWGGPDLYLWPGDYLVSFRLGIGGWTPEAVASVGVVVQPRVMVAVGEVQGQGHFVFMSPEIVACNRTLASLNLTGSDFNNLSAYSNFTLPFRADAFGVYRFPNLFVTNRTEVFLEGITLTQTAPLGFHQPLGCL